MPPKFVGTVKLMLAPIAMADIVPTPRGNLVFKRKSGPRLRGDDYFRPSASSDLLPLQASLALPGGAAEFLAPRHDGELEAGELVDFLADRGAQVGGERGGGILE